MYKIMKGPYTAMHSWYFLVKEYHSATDISTKLIPDCKELRLTTTLETIESVVRPQLVIP